MIVIIAAFYFMYRHFPVNRISVHSELIMLGDLNGDNKWDVDDDKILGDYIKDPFAYSPEQMYKIDVNKNGAIDPEDIAFLKKLYQYKDPYTAQNESSSASLFPRAREFFRYLPAIEYVKRPLYLLNHETMVTDILPFLKKIKVSNLSDNYKDQLLKEVYSEGIRFLLAYDIREKQLTEVEKDYAQRKISACNSLFDQGDYYNLLLNLIGLVEDAETLSVREQSDFIKKILYLRDDLANLLASKIYSEFEQGQRPYSDILAEMDKLIKNDVGLQIETGRLEKPRDYKKLENYVERAEWQYNKSSLSDDNFKKLILFAQYDARYLRTVSNTNRKHSDLFVQNHNLPMILLFREALRIEGGDKKKAVALLDESIRIPFSWVKSIPTAKLTKSLALENFLLPGNKEDGSDKSRHWNVFGGVCLYKSPEESLRLALSREIQDLKDGNYSKEAMKEFIRDTIANINGIYYVVSINPKLVYK